MRVARVPGRRDVRRLSGSIFVWRGCIIKTVVGRAAYCLRAEHRRYERSHLLLCRSWRTS